MPLVLPNDTINDTVADAVPVEQNWSTIEQYVNTNCVTKDGAVGMDAPLLLAGAPTQPLHAATRAYVDAILPVGTMLPYLGAAAPAGEWALANGVRLSVSGYPELYAVIGTRYDTTVPAGTFALPNMRQRFPIGLDDRAAGTADTRFDATGKIGGTFVVPIPQHAHAMAHSHPMPHTHEHPHTHTIAHTHEHPHTHTETVSTSVRQSAASGTTNSFMPSGADGTTRVVSNNPTITVGQPNDATTGGASIGTSGQPSDATSGQPSAASTGAVSTPNTSNTGVTGTAAQLVPQFVTIAYIVRVR